MEIFFSIAIFYGIDISKQPTKFEYLYYEMLPNHPELKIFQ